MALIAVVYLWSSVLYYGILALLDIVKLIFRNGFGKVFTWPKVSKPSCLDDPALGTHGYLHSKDVRIHYVASGPENKSLMLFLHGFPEFWFSWRYQIKEFQKDYRVVAIDMRGYGDSDKPSGIAAYTLDTLASDVKEVILALGYNRCVLVAHDWGGAIAWYFAQQFPDMVNKLIVMNCPPLQVYQKAAVRDPVQLEMSWYFRFFQLPYLPELYFKVNNYGAIESVFDKRGARFSFSETFQNPMSPEEVNAYKYTFSQPGALTPPINYYRNLKFLLSGKVESDINYAMPALLVWGLRDLCLCSANVDVIEEMYPQITIQRIPEAGHFVQMESPELVNQIVKDWLKGQD